MSGHHPWPPPDLPGIPDEEDSPSWSRNLLSLTLGYLGYRRGREALGKSEDMLKKDLMGSLEADVEADEKGHRIFPFADPSGIYQAVKRERRVSQILDEDVAMALVEKYNLQAVCLETITVLNEDGLLAANFQGIIPDEEMKTLYTEKETFALVMVKDSS